MNQQDEVRLDQDAAWRALVFLLQTARAASPAPRSWGPERRWEGYPEVVNPRVWRSLMSKVKEMARLDQEVRNRPQTGSFKISLGDVLPAFEVEVITIPQTNGYECLQLSVPRRSID